MKVIKNALLWLKYHIIPGVAIKTGKVHIIIDAMMWPLVPASLWVIATLYVPIMGTGLDNTQAWLGSLVIIVLMIISLFLHSLAHAVVMKTSDRTAPWRIFLSPLGDPAHAQPPAPTPGKEALAALAGPLAQCMLAALFYFLWDLQLGEFFSTAAFFLVFFNLGLAAFNLIPAFPFDGGRLLRAASWRVLERPGMATRLAGWAGWVIAGGFGVWGVILYLQKDRFSLETAGASLLICVLMVLSLVLHKKWKWDRKEHPSQDSLFVKLIKSAAVAIMMLPLLFITICLAPMNQGIEAPGFTASVEPMVQMPMEYRHESAGSLILVTVIPQAPILAGEWIYARFDSSIRITPPEQIVPKNETAQSVSEDNYAMLQDSETTAVIVGLRLAGYGAEMNYDGVSITSILDTSRALSVLQPDDIITGVNGSPVFSAADLTGQLKLLPAGSTVTMTVIRDGQIIELIVPTMEAALGNESAQIGISILQHSGGFSLPFPVEIGAEKVNGGPSAGLMFTLGVYNLLTDGDLTGGKIIAGTGTIDLEGNVGPIGGVQQKVVAAERAGAEYFLAPEANYADAAAMATRIKVIKVTTAQEAIDFLQTLSQDTPL